jgi:hypothetical protein
MDGNRFEAGEAEPHNHIESLKREACERSAPVNVPTGHQLAVGAGSLVATGALTFYVGEFTQYFANGPAIEEVPIYAAFLAIGLLSIATLPNICGRQDGRTKLAGILSGGAGGLGAGGAIAGIAFSAFVDIFLLGAGTIVGGGIGYWLTRRGRKRHVNCGAVLPCDTWVCPNCFRVINADDIRGKARWTILDIAIFLDQGSYRLNVRHALALMRFHDLFTKGQSIGGNAATWNPRDVIGLVEDEHAMQKFSGLLKEFETSHAGLDTKSYLRAWDELLRDHARSAHKRPRK